MTTAIAPETISAPTLKIADRCDCCGAQAFVMVATQAGHDLLFCGHHFNKNEPALAAQGLNVVVDNRSTINAKPSVSANAI